MRILIDHTTAHSASFADRTRNWEEATRAFLQFVEELCVSTEMWIADTESGGTLQTSMAVRQMIEDVGLKTHAGDALLRTAVISDSELTDLLTRAASALYGTVYEMAESGDLHKSLRQVNVTGEIRASVHAAASIPSMIGSLEWESEHRIRRAGELIADREQGSAAALLLLNAALFKRAKQLARDEPNPNSAVYRHLHLLSRWHINLQLAQYAAGRAGGDLQYAPAYSRATLLAGVYLPRQVAKLQLLQQKSWETFSEYAAVRYGGPRPQAATLPLPLIGAAILLSLPESAQMRDVFSVVGELRTSHFGVAIRDLLSEKRSGLDIESFLKRLSKKLGLAPSMFASLKARLTFMTTPPFAKGELVIEKELTGKHHRSMSETLTYLYSRPDITVLTPFYETLFKEKALRSEVVNRVARILQLAA